MKISIEDVDLWPVRHHLQIFRICSNFLVNEKSVSKYVFVCRKFLLAAIFKIFLFSTSPPRVGISDYLADTVEEVLVVQPIFLHLDVWWEWMLKTLFKCVPLFMLIYWLFHTLTLSYTHVLVVHIFHIKLQSSIGWLIPLNNQVYSSIGCFIPLHQFIDWSFHTLHIKIHPYISLFHTLNINSCINCFIHKFIIDCFRTSISRYITDVFTYPVDTRRPSKQMFSGQQQICLDSNSSNSIQLPSPTTSALA